MYDAEGGEFKRTRAVGGCRGGSWGEGGRPI